MLIAGAALVWGCQNVSSPQPPQHTPPSQQDSVAVLAGAGDIAGCGHPGSAETAYLLGQIGGSVFAAGDNAYPNGTATDYTNCYDPTWGRFEARTYPALGNHEYNTGSANAAFDYFGERVGPRGKGYYSYDLGAWHIVVLNSNLGQINDGDQDAWLRQDLAAHPTRCRLAYWHHPRFSSGPHGSSPALQPLWQILYDAGADIVISGHDHVYERFAPQTPAGALDSARGIREFVVGTGGYSLHQFRTPVPNSEVRYNATFGVLKLTLRPTSYSWQFVPTSGTFTDSGTTACH
jgi:hypothetical protein